MLIMSDRSGGNLTSHVCGAAMGFMAFTISLIVGLLVDNPFITVIMRGLMVLVAFYCLGYFLVAIGHKAIEENFEAEVEANELAAEQAAAERAAAEAAKLAEENQEAGSEQQATEQNENTVAAT